MPRKVSISTHLTLSIFGELLGEATIMARRNPTEQERLRSFLKQIIPDAEKALRKLYSPDRKLIIKNDGTDRLHLLYIPQQKIDNKTFEPIGKPYPVPCREVYYEWEYLAGEIFKWDWKKVAERIGAEDFPQREPPFPIPKFHPQQIEGKRKIDALPISPYLCRKGFPRAFWLLFINRIPVAEWEDIVAKLTEHRYRLKDISNIISRRKSVEMIKRHLLPKKDGLAYLTALYNLRYMVEEEDSDRLKEYSLGLKNMVEKYDFFSHAEFIKRAKEWKTEIDKTWEQYKGPSKKYGEASRHLCPLVKELSNHLSSVLQKYMGREMSARWATYPKEYWDEEAERDQEQPAWEEIYRIVGDLIRFFIDWHELSPFGSGIKPLPWGEDLFWVDVPEEKRTKYVSAGKRMRNMFGERIKKIVS